MFQSFLFFSFVFLLFSFGYYIGSGHLTGDNDLNTLIFVLFVVIWCQYSYVRRLCLTFLNVLLKVRVDLLSASGKTLASSRRPSMLQFMSEPIRLVMTFLKIAPLLTGCVAEAQTLNLMFRGFTEGDVPTSCIRVTIEQRAEYRPGAGIPEVYDAVLILETELSLFKKVIWYWKKTIFIWMSMMSFMMQLVFTLVCCRSIVIPKARPRDGSARTIGNQDGPPTQG